MNVPDIPMEASPVRKEDLSTALPGMNLLHITQSSYEMSPNMPEGLLEGKTADEILQLTICGLPWAALHS